MPKKQFCVFGSFHLLPASCAFSLSLLEAYIWRAYLASSFLLPYRESKRKLMGLMQQWSQWQAKHQLSSSVMRLLFSSDCMMSYVHLSVYLMNKFLSKRLKVDRMLHEHRHDVWTLTYLFMIHQGIRKHDRATHRETIEA